MSTKKIFRMSHRLEEIRFKYLYYTSRSVTCVRLAEAVRCLEDEEGRKGGRLVVRTELRGQPTCTRASSFALQGVGGV